MTKLKALADNKLNIAKMTISLSDRAESTVEKEENAFPRVYSKAFFFRVIKSLDCVVKS